MARISADGRIGFCEYHKKWFALFPDAEGQAGEANRLYREEQQRLREEERRKALQDEKDRKSRARKRLLLKLFLIALGVLAAAAAFLWFKVIPEKGYREAGQLLNEGNYEEALAAYARLGNYADSPRKALMAEALLSVDRGDSQRAQELFDELVFDDAAVSELAASIERVPPAMARTGLMELLISSCGKRGRDTADLRKDLSEDLTSVLSSWKEQGLSPEDVYSLKATAGRADLSGIDATESIKEAGTALAEAEGTVTGMLAFESDSEEAERSMLLTAYDDGRAVLYEIYPEYLAVASVETSLSEPALEAVENALSPASTGKTALLVSGKQDGFGVLSYSASGLSVVLFENELTDLDREGQVLTYGKELEGSIERSRRYRWSLEEPEVAPEVTGTDWHEDDYPYPDTPDLLVTRLMEAKCYGISEEESLLTADGAPAEDSFSLKTLKTLKALPAPEKVSDIEAALYEDRGDTCLYEVRYVSGSDPVTAYLAVVRDGEWKAVGASDSFLEDTDADTVPEIDYGTELLPVNREVTGHLKDADSRDLYRILLSSGSRVQLIWQAGDTQENSTAFVIKLLDAEDLSQPVNTYEVKLSAAKQMTTPIFLSAGVYYLQVEPKKYVDTDYHLELVAGQEEHSEQEPNDTSENASCIETGETYAASLYKESDVDCFAFTVEEPGALRLVIESPEDGTKRSKYLAELFEATGGTLLSTLEVPGTQSVTESGTVYVGGGEYLVKIAKGQSWAADPYSFRVDYSENERAEREVNDAKEQATEAAENEPVTGSFGTEEDVDYYVFQAGSDVILQPKLTFAGLENSSKTYVLTLSDADQILYTASIGGKETAKVLSPFPLKAGSYYVRLENPNFTSQDYQLTLTAMAVQAAEAEPNQELAAATPLEVGQEMTGVLSSQEDVDLYKVSLAEETVLTLDFRFAETSVTGTAFTVRLEQNGKALWSENVSGSGGGVTKKLQIPAGEYFLRVKPGTWVSAVYTISLS